MTTWTDLRPLRHVVPVVFLTGLVLVGTLGTGGCAGREASDPALSDSTYVHVMSRLAVIRGAGRRGPRSAPDNLIRESVDSLLAEAGVERAAMLDFARMVGDEPERMAEIWTRIQAEADSLRQAGWDPPGPVAPSRPPDQP